MIIHDLIFVFKMMTLNCNIYTGMKLKLTCTKIFKHEFNRANSFLDSELGKTNFLNFSKTIKIFKSKKRKTRDIITLYCTDEIIHLIKIQSAVYQEK